MELLLIRHGESEADILQVHEGRADFSLTDLGRKQVELMAKRVKRDWKPDFIWASTLKRARETAEVLARETGSPIRFEDDLMEHHNGVLAGLSFEEGKRYMKPRHPHERIEQGESDLEFRFRIESIFSRILLESSHERIAIVAHGGVINHLLRSFLQLPIGAEYYFWNGDTAIHHLEIKGTRRYVHRMNDTSHLQELSLHM